MDKIQISFLVIKPVSHGRILLYLKDNITTLSAKIMG